MNNNNNNLELIPNCDCGAELQSMKHTMQEKICREYSRHQ